MQAPESYQVRPELPSEIGFPTLTSDASLKQKNNKQTGHE